MFLERLFPFVLCLSTVYESATEQSCDGSLLSKNGKFSKSDVSGLITIDNKSQIKMCLVVLGNNPLDARIAELLWRDLVKVYKTADDVPENELQFLGWIATGIPAPDFMNLSLTEIDTIAAFGQWRNFSKEQLTSLKQAIEYQWSYKGPSDLSGFDLAALGQVLCAFNTSQIAAIKPLAFKAAAGHISNLIDCPEEIIREFAMLATSKDAFGDPSEWTAIQVAVIGCVIAGLDSMQDIRPDAFEGLSASSMRCLPTHTLQTMSMDQLSHLSLSAVNALTYAQRSSLDSEQIKAILGTPKILDSVRNRGSTSRAWPLTLMTVLLTFLSTPLI